MAKAKKTDAQIIELLTSINNKLEVLLVLTQVANRQAGCYETVREAAERAARALPPGQRFINDKPKPKKGE